MTKQRDKKRITTFLVKERAEKIERMANDNGLSMSAYTAMILSEHIREKEKVSQK